MKFYIVPDGPVKLILAKMFEEIQNTEALIAISWAILSQGERCKIMRLTLCEVPMCIARPDHNTGNYMPSIGRDEMIISTNLI